MQDRKPAPAARPPAPTPVAVARPPELEPTPASPCEREGRDLAKLRSNPVPSEIQRLSGSLTCEALRPQVARLLESFGPGDAPATPSPVRLTAPVETTVHLPAAVPPPTPQAGSDPRSCKVEALVLADIRASRDVGAVTRFAAGLRCEALRPQVQRLRESLSDD